MNFIIVTLLLVCEPYNSYIVNDAYHKCELGRTTYYKASKVDDMEDYPYAICKSSEPRPLRGDPYDRIYKDCQHKIAIGCTIEVNHDRINVKQGCDHFKKVEL